MGLIIPCNMFSVVLPTPLPFPFPLVLAPVPLLLTSSGHHWIAVHLRNLPQTSTDIWWPPKHVRLVSGQYASHWNAFLSLLLSNFKLSMLKIGTLPSLIKIRQSDNFHFNLKSIH